MMEEGGTVSNRTLTEKYLKKYGSFVEKYSQRLIFLLLLAEDVDPPPDDPEGRTLLSWTKSYATSQHIWDPSAVPISLSWSPSEEGGGEGGLLEEVVGIPLPPEGNPDVQKVILVLGNLISQMDSLKGQVKRKFLIPLQIYGEGNTGGGEEGDGHLAVSLFIPVLLKLQEFVRLGKEFCVHWVEQVGSLFKEKKPHVMSISSLQLPTVFKSFGDFLAIFILLDEVIRSQVVLQEHWAKYRQMIGSVQADSSTFGTDGDKLNVLERELFFLDREVMTAQTFRMILTEVTTKAKKGGGGILQEKFQSYLAHVAPTIEKDFVEGSDELKPIGTAGLFIFASFLYGAGPEWRKFFQKHLQEPMKRIPSVCFGSSVVWVPEVFLNNFNIGNSQLFDSRGLQLGTTNRQNYLQQRTSSLSKDVVNATLNVAQWSVKMQSVFHSKALNQLNLEDLARRCNVLLQGVKLAQGLNQSFRMIMSLHAYLGKPVTKQVVCLVCNILELMKEIECVYLRESIHVAKSSVYIVQHVLNTALNSLKGVQKLLSSPELRKIDELRADSLSALKILESSLRGPPSPPRLLGARLALDVALSNVKLWKGGDSAGEILPSAIERIELLLGLHQRVGEVCNGSELLYHRIILPTYFSSVYSNEIDAGKLPLLFLAMGDCYRILQHSPHGDKAREGFAQEINGYLQQTLVDRMGQDVETDLRLMAHSHLQVQGQQAISPFRVGVKDYLYHIMSSTLTFQPYNSLNLKLMVEHYLSKTFYNLASVALHDWQSYATMRVLANEKYGLQVLEDHLPGHSLEQGRDILDIVRNLPKFVKEFTYNLNNQVFVQVSSNNKHLDTVNIRHLANSMRIHGVGMMNTTVNAAYQFLRTKMHIFSQCLHEEQIRSRLAKDIRHFKQIKQEPSVVGQTADFPFKVAEKFKKGIKKFGIQDGLTWLDKFRILITQIGNALGFVRLVRAGGLHYLAGGCGFVPDLQDMFTFNLDKDTNEGNAEDEGRHTSSDPQLYAQLKDATEELNITLQNLFGGEDYFGLLVRAFRGGYSKERNSHHLKNFFVIIPALTLSYVDHLRQCKEVLVKKPKSDVIFTDDGFPMGVAYLLQVLEQDDDFDSLGWFHSVTHHYQDEQRKEVQTINDAGTDQKLEQASRLTAKRFQDQAQEFELLRFNLSSARIFFSGYSNNDKETNNKLTTVQ